MKRFLGILLLLGTLMLAGGAPTARAQSGGGVLVLTAKGAITPVMVSYIQRGIARAETQRAEALIIELDTPGGQVDLTRTIIKSIINADVPVVVYVYPPGGFAASAGTFITLSAHVAAMAPQTSIGAASPVNAQGGDISDTLRAKLENILVADMQNLAERRGEKAVQWATDAIREAKAANAKTALDLGVIDIIARDLKDLLAQLNGRTVEVRGEMRTLHTVGVPVQPLPMTLAEQFLAIILRPEIAFILLAIGPLAIIYELANPGGYVGGVIGVICLVLGLYAVGQLPVNYAGVGLLALAIVLFTVDVFAPTHGALTTLGVVSLVMGGLLMFNQNELGYQISVAPIVATAVALGLFFFFIVGKAVATLKMRPSTGAERLIGMTGIVKAPIAPPERGIVLADGTRWQAVSADDTPITEGETVEIVGVQGLTVTVKKSMNNEK